MRPVIAMIALCGCAASTTPDAPEPATLELDYQAECSVTVGRPDALTTLSYRLSQPADGPLEVGCDVARGDVLEPGEPIGDRECAVSMGDESWRMYVSEQSIVARYDGSPRLRVGTGRALLEDCQVMAADSAGNWTAATLADVL